MFCQKCGKEINNNDNFCPNCGFAVKIPEEMKSLPQKSYLITLALCFCTGTLGLHRFYTGYILIGITQLVLAFSIIGAPLAMTWALVDLIFIIQDKYKTSKNIELGNSPARLNRVVKNSLSTAIGFIGVVFILNFANIIFSGEISSALEDTVKTDEDKTLLTKEKYGENYPYTIDNLKLKCENNAVWVEDSVHNKYALNGLAAGKFQGKSDYMGYTSEIQDPTKEIDGNFLNMGFELCK